ncbi:MAG: magnesium chelatase, partial [Pirellulaceae bacterium]
MSDRPSTLAELRESGWQSRMVKEEIRENFVRALEAGETLFPGIIGFEDTVIPEISLALLAGHDMLFLGEKGQAKSRLMRSLVRFLDPHIPFLDIPGVVVHEDPLSPITDRARQFLRQHADQDVPILWWAAEDRYAERLAPGTKFADIIGELDPGKLASGESMST